MLSSRSSIHSINLSPDIQVKHHQILSHLQQKNKIIEQFSFILKQLCDWQQYTSKTYDKFANSISKLIIGKDPLKQVFILFQRILATKADQAEKMAVNIKQDMMPFLQSNAIDLKEQQNLKLQQIAVKQLKNNMLNKLKTLQSAQLTYKSTCEEYTNFKSSSSTTQSREFLQQLKYLQRSFIDSQTFLTETINIFNHCIQDYMLNYTNLCEKISTVQSNRKSTIKQSISKYIVFEMDCIKNIQYDLCRYAKSIEIMETKMILQDKVGLGQAGENNANNSQSNNGNNNAGQYKHNNQVNYLAMPMSIYNHNNINNRATYQLAKISAHNYINYLNQTYFNIKSSQFPQHFSISYQKWSEIKRYLDSQKNHNFILKKQIAYEIINDVNQLLYEVIQNYDIKIIKEIVHYLEKWAINVSLNVKINKQEQKNNESNQNNQKIKQNDLVTQKYLRIPLMKPILCHPIFQNQQFWNRYSSRLSDIIQRQISSSSLSLFTSSLQKKKSFSSFSSNYTQDEIKISLNFLSSDIEFMKKLLSVSLIQKIFKMYKDIIQNKIIRIVKII